MAAILDFPFFDQEPIERRFGSWHIWNQHTQKPLYANFHAFLNKCTLISHICPTNRVAYYEKPNLLERLHVHIWWGRVAHKKGSTL